MNTSMWFLAVNDALNLLVEDKVEGVVSMLSCLCSQVSTVTMAQPQGHFGYRIIRIIKTSSLGVGSYGAVYRALCDELPCAVKVIHPTLFETHDPGAQRSWNDSNKNANS